MATVNPGAVPPRSRPANGARRGAAPPPTWPWPWPCPAPPLCAGPVITLPSALRREGSGSCTPRALAGSSFRLFHFPTMYPVHSELFHSVFPASSLSRIKGKRQSVCHYILDKQPLLCCLFPIHWLFFLFKTEVALVNNIIQISGVQHCSSVSVYAVGRSSLQVCFRPLPCLGLINSSPNDCLVFDG